MKVNRFFAYTAFAPIMVFMSSDTALSKQSEKATGFGHITSEGVFIARVKPVEKMLKGCGIKLGDILSTPHGRFPKKSCNANQKERQ